MKSYIYKVFANCRKGIFLCLICIYCGCFTYAMTAGGEAAAEVVRANRSAMMAGLPVQSSSVEEISNAAPVSNTEPMPAKVVLKHGTLTVEANNSDLSQILREIAAASGMTIDGAIRSIRVYGVYGPNSSRSVLTALLQGLGYNFMMVGSTEDGAPKELTITPETGSVTPAPVATSPQNPETEDEEAPGRGAVVDVPPPPPDDIQERMQQHLRHLEQMHDPMQNQPQ